MAENKDEHKEKSFPPQQQQEPGSEAAMKPKPKAEDPNYKAAGKLNGKVAIITGGDSGIGRASAGPKEKPRESEVFLLLDDGYHPDRSDAAIRAPYQS